MEISTKKNGVKSLFLVTFLLVNQLVSAQTFDYFKDTVWHFGVNAPGSDVAPGLIFSKDATDWFSIANESTKKFRMNSIGKSFSTNVAICGSYIFYVTKDTDGKQKVFNWKHQPMLGGDLGLTFEFTDGMASAYIGDNKYVFFVVTDELEGSLDCYIIDMRGDGGNGKMTKQTITINAPNSKISQGIELVPILGTGDEFRLVYYEREFSGTNVTSKNLRISKVKLSADKLSVNVNLEKSIQNPIPSSLSWANFTSTVQDISGRTNNFGDDPVVVLLYNTSGSNYGSYGTASYSMGNTPKLKRNLTYTYDSPPGSGGISYLTGAYSSAIDMMGITVYAGGKSVTSTGITSFRGISYGDFAAETPPRPPYFNHVTIPIPGGNVGGPEYIPPQDGGGIKVAPDNTVYVKLKEGMMASIMGVPPTLYDTTFLKKSGGMNFSNGLTSPAEIPTGLIDDRNNKAPVTVKDIVYANPANLVVIKPLDNDNDPEGGELFLSGVYFKNPADESKGTLVRDADKKEVKFIADKGYTFALGEKLELIYVVRDNSVLNSMCNEGIIEIRNEKTYPTSTMFSDDVWFFGNNMGVAEAVEGVDGKLKSSKGIIFKKNRYNVYERTDASNTSKVNSWENSLSVSTPACNGDFIFYAQHNKVFNSVHDEMPNGGFEGHSSNADGLAAAYLGDNKYILVSVSAPGNGNLNYNIIDMTLDKMGDIMPGKKNLPIDASVKVSEGIEMIPVVGTSNKYWLVYFRRDSKKIMVKKVEGIDPENPTITDVGEFDMSHILATTTYANYLYKMQADITGTTIALQFAGQSPATNGTKNYIQLLNFDPTSGTVSHNSSIDLQNANSNDLKYMSFVFYDKYLYIACATLSTVPGMGGAEYEIYQYDFELGGDFPHKKKVISKVNKPMLWAGGGMKLGPDGKIYFIRQGSKFMGVINKPGELLDAPNNFEEEGFEITSEGYGIAMSTGITPPWIDPINNNKKPVANMDIVTTYDSLPVSISPTDNDEDEDGPVSDLSVTLVEFVNKNDTLKINVENNATSKLVTFTQYDSYAVERDTTFTLIYNIRDKGAPIQLCDESVIKLVIRALPVISLKDSCSFEPKIVIDIQNSKVEFVWQKYDGTNWIDVAGSKDKIYLANPEEGSYRIRIYHKDNTAKETYTKAKEYKIIAQHKVANRIWYETTLE